MAKTVVALFDDMNSAQAAANDLIGAGFDRSDISVVANPGTGGGTAAISDTGSGAGDTAVARSGTPGRR